MQLLDKRVNTNFKLVPLPPPGGTAGQQGGGTEGEEDYYYYGERERKVHKWQVKIAGQDFTGHSIRVRKSEIGRHSLTKHLSG